MNRREGKDEKEEPDELHEDEGEKEDEEERDGSWAGREGMLGDCCGQESPHAGAVCETVFIPRYRLLEGAS